MLDFMTVVSSPAKKGVIEIFPDFQCRRSADLMIRGSDFYAIWVEDRGLWSTDEQDAITLIDAELDRYVEEHQGQFEYPPRVLYLRSARTGQIDKWHKYCKQQMWDQYVPLDEKLIFANSPTNKSDYASKRLPYPLEPGDISAYDRLMSVLYSGAERRKIEWAIGSIVVGDSKTLQKFMVLYGAGGTGKGTILKIVEQLFSGYCESFSAKSLGSASDAFALESFRTNPLVAIDPDGDLSRIEDNTRINTLVAHENLVVNEKFKTTYSSRFKCFLFIGSNRPVKITDAKSGLIRRLIDVSPTGDTFNVIEYDSLMNQIPFELGAIACHCRDVYMQNKHLYDHYIPTTMLSASNDFYNFVFDSYMVFEQEDGISFQRAWEMYNTYCSDAKVLYPYSLRVFKEELKNYFQEYLERVTLKDGRRIRSYYKGFKRSLFEKTGNELVQEEMAKPPIPEWLIFSSRDSLLDVMLAECPAQYATEEGTPFKKWTNVTTRLKDLDTSRLHYVKPDTVQHIVIDFDIPGDDGEKSLEKNLEAASTWIKTYAELSKSGSGIHLHYLYSGDATKLARIVSDHVECKVFDGNSSLRRKLTLCNDIPVATISSGLPMKEEKMVNFTVLKNEKALRTTINKCLKKEVWPSTKQNMDMIAKALNDAYESHMVYDVSDLYNKVLLFAVNSTHQSDSCLKILSSLPFKSEAVSENKENAKLPIIFFDVEVFPNLLIVCYKEAGKDKNVVRMINPSPQEIELLVTDGLLTGFNNRKYDNHILYARLIGYSFDRIYRLSQDIIAGKSNVFFGEAYNLSYTDIYDFSSKKQSLKKFEIELGIHHQELGLPWDKPVPEDLWGKVAEYCENDVLATEAVWNSKKIQSDFTARKILAAVAGMTVNDTTNSLTTKIIFGSNRKPQGSFNYRDMGAMSEIVSENDDDFTCFDSLGRPIFPGYVYEYGKSTYRGEEVGEGGYVYAEPGMYTNVALLDIASMHPSSIIAEKLFGEEYTRRFEEIVQARIYIKHGDFESAKKVLNGALVPFLTDESAAKDLAQALKIAINSVYGLTAAKFDNAFRDIRNKDNIVAKRGALFMVNLKHEVQEQGYVVAHIKTDSIKIPNATPEIIQFVMDYGKRYGYSFEHEDTYDRMCLVNDAVYIAKYLQPHKDKETGKDIWWTATGKQFQVPYVFKTLFSHDEIEFDDMCETNSVSSTALYLDFNEKLPDVTKLEKERAKLWKEGLPVPEGLENEISSGHNYRFIGKVGSFCPIKPGCDGGELVRQGFDKMGHEKFDSVSGAKGYRWKEAEVVRQLNIEDQINKNYYNSLVNDAVSAISNYGDFEWFVSDDPKPSPGVAPYDIPGEPWELEEGNAFNVR